MSLLLRKQCQPVLDAVGLQNYHVRISDDMWKVLVISGECGKPLCRVEGIKFSKANPTAAERDYATELLDAWVVTHKAKIDNVVKLATAFSKLPPMEPDTKDGFKVRLNAYGDSYIDVIDDSNMTKTCVTFEGKVFALSALGGIDGALSVTNFKLNKKKITKAVAYGKDFAAYVKKQEELQDAKSQLAACEI